MKPINIYTFIILLLTLTTVTVLAQSPALNDQTKKVDTKSARDEESLIQKTITLLNKERARAKLPPLKRLDSLCKAAHWLAQDMVNHNYLDHVDSKGRDVDSRLGDFGYLHFQVMGENIATGQTTPAEVVTNWMQSPGHRANVLSPDYSEIGISCVVSNQKLGELYWVANFGVRDGIFSFVINDDDMQTKKPEIKLYIYGKDWADKMRVSNDGAKWTEWEPFHSTRDWKVTPEDGKKVVYVELRHEDETRSFSSTIELAKSAQPDPKSDNSHKTTSK